MVAAAVGAVGVVLAVVLLISVAALIGSGDGLTAGTLVVPVGRIVVVVALGYLVALALLVRALRSGSSVQAWLSVGVAVVVAFGVSVYPLVATASAAVDQARDIVPWILDLIRR
ncbi:hypothetical protein GCM10022204_08810 [Microlunatus aurantiacus]|uniref:Uncharacterized protein n=2 Tax=Microlunatus aurantiacus TaxID=446786 RepID=A0ABP7CS48_9ACTN